MKKHTIALRNLITDLNASLNDNTGETVLMSLIGKMITDQKVDVDAYFSQVIEEEWVRTAALMAMRTRLMQLQLQINILTARVSVNSFSITNLGVKLYEAETA